MWGSARDDDSVLAVFWRSVTFLRILGLAFDINKSIDCWEPRTAPEGLYVDPPGDDPFLALRQNIRSEIQQNIIVNQ
jgi:hypothetical protein